MKVALLQLNSGDLPAENLVQTVAYVREAAKQGATFILTPEVTNCVSLSRSHQSAVLQFEDNDLTLRALRAEAKALGVWISIGSLALKTDDVDGRFANRSFLLAPDGSIAAHYDKIHMFDVAVTETETFRESEGYRPGSRTAVAHVGDALVGLSICYDIRFPHLFRTLAKAGADILLVPAAFSPVTGAAHWETLLRARAIETGCFVLAAAQTGTHPSTTGKKRSTYGHSLAVDPWGRILCDAGMEPGISILEIDLSEVSKVRSQIPALTHDRPFEGPQ